MSSWLDYTINGLIVGNVYALVAVGLALIFGVSRLINFAQGSIYLVGAYIGWVAVVQLHTPLPLTIILVAASADYIQPMHREAHPHKQPAHHIFQNHQAKLKKKFSKKIFG